MRYRISTMEGVDKELETLEKCRTLLAEAEQSHKNQDIMLLDDNKFFDKEFKKLKNYEKELAALATSISNSYVVEEQQKTTLLEELSDIVKQNVSENIMEISKITGLIYSGELSRTWHFKNKTNGAYGVRIPVDDNFNQENLDKFNQEGLEILLQNTQENEKYIEVRKEGYPILEDEEIVNKINKLAKKISEEIQ